VNRIKTKDIFPFKDFIRAFEELLSAITAGIQYILLIGESGVGKSSLLKLAKKELDPCRFRTNYFNLNKLNACGIVRVTARSLRVPIRRSLSETIEGITSVLADEACTTCIWVDEAHLVPDNTLTGLRTLAESDLSGRGRFLVLLSGLPPLRGRLQTPHLFPLWRRILTRIEIIGLQLDEGRPFAGHRLGKKHESRFSNEAIRLIFEHSRGIPGLFGPYLDLVARKLPKGRIAPEAALEIIQQWDLA
jgi:type II secretory pathway predicted ATPase ExeA